MYLVNLVTNSCSGGTLLLLLLLPLLLLLSSLLFRSIGMLLSLLLFIHTLPSPLYFCKPSQEKGLYGPSSSDAQEGVDARMGSTTRIDGWVSLYVNLFSVGFNTSLILWINRCTSYSWQKIFVGNTVVQTIQQTTCTVSRFKWAFVFDGFSSWLDFDATKTIATTLQHPLDQQMWQLQSTGEYCW